MIKCLVELYCIVFDKDNQKYQVLSEHSENFMVLSKGLDEKTNDINIVLYNLLEDHIDMSADYIRFIHLEPRIENQKIILSYFCLIPYNIELKKCYKYYTENLLNDYPVLRKIINMA